MFIDNRKALCLLSALVLAPFVLTAQSYSVPGGNTIVFTGDWPSAELQIVLSEARQLWPAMASVSQATGTQWTVTYETQHPLSYDPCKTTSAMNGQLDLFQAGRQLSLAMFTVCRFNSSDPTSAQKEGLARARTNLMLRAVAATGTSGLMPATSLAVMSSNASQKYFGAGGSLTLGENHGNVHAVAAAFELFAAKLGGASPTLAPLDAAWAAVQASATGAADRWPLFQAATDRTVGKIAGRSASSWLQLEPGAFVMPASRRAALGLATAGDPTDGTWLQTYWWGSMTGWTSSTVVNPNVVGVQLNTHQGGASQPVAAHTAKLRILDTSGSTELYSTNLAISGGTATLSLPATVVAGLTDGAYPAETCILQADGKSCDPQMDLVQHIVVDHSSWTAGKLVVIANGPAYPSLVGESLSLVSGQPYVLTTRPGAIAIGGLPSSYTEVALTDGSYTRKFPWVPDVPNGNIWMWTPFDDPNLLSILNAATFQPAAVGTAWQIAPNSWYTLATVGATPGDPDFPAATASGFPTQGCTNEYGNTKVTFSMPGQSWTASMNYCSWGQINILTPSTLPVGQSVIVQIFRNGVASNPLSATVISAAPSVFLSDAPRQYGAITFAAGPHAGEVASVTQTAHVGDALSVYYTGCGPLSETLAPGQPAPLDRLIYATLPRSVKVGDVSADVSFNGLAPGFAGLCQLNFVVPVPLSGSTSPANTLKVAPVRIAIGQQEANTLALPIVFEPNGSYLGNPAAKVTIVQYGDYQCPYCTMFFTGTWLQLKAEYVDTGKAKFLFQDMAFLGSDSTTSAQAAHCAGDQYRFWQYHDYLYNHQGGENSGWGSAARQKQFAATMGLNADQFGQCLDSAKYGQEVRDETAAARSQHVTGVPSFIVNGKLAPGNGELSALEQAINAALNQ